MKRRCSNCGHSFDLKFLTDRVASMGDPNMNCPDCSTACTWEDPDKDITIRLSLADLGSLSVLSEVGARRLTWENRIVPFIELQESIVKKIRPQVPPGGLLTIQEHSSDMIKAGIDPNTYLVPKNPLCLN